QSRGEVGRRGDFRRGKQTGEVFEAVYQHALAGLDRGDEGLGVVRRQVQRLFQRSGVALGGGDNRVQRRRGGADGVVVAMGGEFRDVVVMVVPQHDDLLAVTTSVFIQSQRQHRRLPDVLAVHHNDDVGVRGEITVGAAQ